MPGYIRDPDFVSIRSCPAQTCLCEFELLATWFLGGGPEVKGQGLNRQGLIRALRRQHVRRVCACREFDNGPPRAEEIGESRGEFPGREGVAESSMEAG